MIIIKHLNYFSSTVHSVNMTNQFKRIILTNEGIFKSQNSCINITSPFPILIYFISHIHSTLVTYLIR